MHITDRDKALFETLQKKLPLTHKYYKFITSYFDREKTKANASVSKKNDSNIRFQKVTHLASLNSKSQIVESHLGEKSELSISDQSINHSQKVFHMKQINILKNPDSIPFQSNVYCTKKKNQKSLTKTSDNNIRKDSITPLDNYSEKKLLLTTLSSNEKLTHTHAQNLSSAAIGTNHWSLYRKVRSCNHKNTAKNEDLEILLKNFDMDTTEISQESDISYENEVCENFEISNDIEPDNLSHISYLIYDGFDGMPHPYWGIEVEQSSWVSIPNPDTLDPECELLNKLTVNKHYLKFNSNLLLRYHKQVLNQNISFEDFANRHLTAFELSQLYNYQEYDKREIIHSLEEDYIKKNIGNIKSFCGFDSNGFDIFQEIIMFQKHIFNYIHKSSIEKISFEEWMEEKRCYLSTQFPVDPNWRNVYSCQFYTVESNFNQYTSIKDSYLSDNFTKSFFRKKCVKYTRSSSSIDLTRLKRKSSDVYTHLYPLLKSNTYVMSDSSLMHRRNFSPDQNRILQNKKNFHKKKKDKDQSFVSLHDNYKKDQEELNECLNRVDILRNIDKLKSKMQKNYNPTHFESVTCISNSSNEHIKEHLKKKKKMPLFTPPPFFCYPSKKSITTKDPIWPSFIIRLFRGPSCYNDILEILYWMMPFLEKFCQLDNSSINSKNRMWIGGYMIPSDEKRCNCELNQMNSMLSYVFSTDGDDSWFGSENLMCLGVCDGVGAMSGKQWSIAGFDCRAFGENILRYFSLSYTNTQLIRGAREYIRSFRGKKNINGNKKNRKTDEAPLSTCYLADKLNPDITKTAEKPSLIAFNSLIFGFNEGQKTWGASTCLIGCLNSDGSKIGFSNLGDSRAIILRRNYNELNMMSIIGITNAEQHSLNLPLQLTRFPPKSIVDEMRKDPRLKDLVDVLIMALKDKNENEDSPEKAVLYDFDIQEGDLIVAATDGLWDNVFLEDIIILCSISLSPKESKIITSTTLYATSPRDIAKGLCLAAYWKIAQKEVETPFYRSLLTNGFSSKLTAKPDDVTVVVAWVVHDEDENSLNLLFKFENEMGYNYSSI